MCKFISLLKCRMKKNNQKASAILLIKFNLQSKKQFPLRVSAQYNLQHMKIQIKKAPSALIEVTIFFTLLHKITIRQSERMVAYVTKQQAESRSRGTFSLSSSSPMSTSDSRPPPATLNKPINTNLRVLFYKNTFDFNFSFTIMVEYLYSITNSERKISQK